MTATFYSNGKLLLTGEYLVLEGCQALALPLRRGQSLSVSSGNTPGQILWKSFYNQKLFFEGIYSLRDKTFTKSTNNLISNYLKRILNFTTESLSQKVHSNGTIINTHIDFPLEWGLGSSSTLINNLANWLQIDPFQLNHQMNAGSGYDIACARSEQALIYQLKKGQPAYETIHFNPPFRDQLYLIYTGKKQDSQKEVEKFMNQPSYGQKDIKEIHSINQQIREAVTLSDFEKAIRKHEQLMANILKSPPVKEHKFPDYPGTLKSLGAWGGDFILATWTKSREELVEYFKQYNLQTMFSWEELIKNHRDVKQEIQR